MDLYAENILDHFKHPRHKTPVASPSAEHEEINHSCGDAVKLQIRLENGAIAELGWNGQGCAISQAGMSILSEELTGMKTEDAETITQTHVRELLGVPVGPRRFKCALLGLHTLKNTLRIARGEQPQSWTETVGSEDGAAHGN